MTHPTRSVRFTRLVALVAAGVFAGAALVSAQSNEGSFQRTLKVDGPVELAIRSGSGHIHVVPGAAGSVAISARIRADRSWFSGDVTAQIRQIEKNPPIEQTGNRIRVGWLADEDLGRHVSISYDVTVPADSSVAANTGSGGIEVGDLKGAVEAKSGSGGITVGHVGGAVTASTGSGGIEVAGAASLNARSGSGSIKGLGIAGPAKANTGSGGVQIVQTAKGGVDVSSASGEVVVSGVDGTATVSASSGGIVVEGRPSGAWSIHASSGSVTLRLPADAAFDLDARASSGGIHSAHPITMSGSIDRNHLQGKVRGGGALVEVHTSSGGIRIQ
jgi:hypothetical protein